MFPFVGQVERFWLQSDAAVCVLAGIGLSRTHSELQRRVGYERLWRTVSWVFTLTLLVQMVHNNHGWALSITTFFLNLNTVSWVVLDFLWLTNWFNILKFDVYLQDFTTWWRKSHQVSQHWNFLLIYFSIEEKPLLLHFCCCWFVVKWLYLALAEMQIHPCNIQTCRQ